MTLGAPRNAEDVVGETLVQALEWYELGNGDLIVNITDVEDTSVVTNEFSRDWDWAAVQVRVLVLPTEDDDEWEGPTEWMTLTGAVRRPQPLEVAA